MVLTKDIDLPTEKELTVPEVTVSASVLRAAAFHLGKHCENVNNVSYDSFNMHIKYVVTSCHYLCN